MDLRHPVSYIFLTLAFSQWLFRHGFFKMSAWKWIFLNMSMIFGTLCLARAGKVHPFSCRHLEKAMAEKPSWKSTSSKYVWDRVPQIHTLCSNPFWFISYALTFSRFYEKFMLFMKIRKWWNLWYSQVSIKRAARLTTYICS